MASLTKLRKQLAARDRYLARCEGLTGQAAPRLSTAHRRAITRVAAEEDRRNVRNLHPSDGSPR